MLTLTEVRAAEARGQEEDHLSSQHKENNKNTIIFGKIKL